MYTIEERITIDAPKEDVWEFMIDPDKVLLYNTGITEWERLGDTMEKGTEGRGVVRFLGRRIEFTAEVAEFVDGAKIGWRMIDGPFDMYWEFRVDGVEAGTELTYYVESPLGGFFGHFADPLVHKLYTREVASMVQKIKELIEA